jgi:signal transduction histidine kinase
MARANFIDLTMKALIGLFFFLSLNAFAQQSDVFRIDSLPAQGILLDKGWKFHAGDNPDFAKPDFDDSAWEPIDPTKDIMDLPQIIDSKIKWLRLDFVVKSKLSEPIGLAINQSGASEIYLNGRLVKQIGHFDVDLNKVIANNPKAIPIYLPVDSAGKYNLAIRYILQPNIHYTKLFNTRNLFFKASLAPLVPTFNSELNNKSYRVGLDMFKFGIFLMLFILHAAFYFNQKNDRAHFLLALIFLSSVAVYMLKIVVQYNSIVPDLFWYLNFNIFLYNLAFCLQLAVLYHFAKVKIDFPYWAVTVFSFIAGFSAIFSYNYGGLNSLLTTTVGLFFLLRITIIGLKKKIRGFKFLSFSLIINILSFISFRLSVLQVFKISDYLVELIFNIGVMAFPIGLSIYMGLEASYTNKELTEKLTENEILKEHAVNQEKEKQQILSTQNETLELQVNERTAELSHKNQELVIEAALERVRSHSMAMQHSDDLQKVITVVSEQLQALGFQFDLVNFVVINTTVADGWHAYNALPYQSTITHFYIPYLDHKLFNQASESLQDGLDFYTYSLSHEEKNRFYTHCFERTVLKEVPEENKQHLYNVQGMAASVVIFSDRKLALSIINYQSIPYRDEENAVFRRFGAVFGQAYTRFLDLKKAEAQAREAKIETALERVRSRSLAMHSTDELKEVIALVFAQLSQVDVAITDGSAVINLYTENSKDTIHWTINPDLVTEAKSFRMPYFGHSLQSLYWDAHEKGLDFLAHSFTLEEKNSFWDQAFIVSDYKYLPEEIKQWMYDAPGYAFSVAFGKYSDIIMDSFSGKMYSDRENEILKRFARVFEQAYVRFLDLQKAEDQAKEAQIEAALERVRSQSMAMRHSEDLLKVVHIINEQLHALNFEVGMTNFVKLRTNAEDGWDSYNAIPGISKITGFYIPYFDHKIFNQINESLQQGLDFNSYILTEEEKFSFLKHTYENTVLKDVVPEERKQQVYNFPGWASSIILFSDKKLTLSIIKFQSIPYTDEENAIFKRFGAVFEQAYTRFLDLQKAEEQARQAIRTASLDRVRAQIASMRTTQDLERITPLIWNELSILQVPFFRCGVFIVNEAEHLIHAFLSTPDGQARTQLNLPIDDTSTNQQLLSSWQEQQVYRERWSHEQLQQWVASMIEVGQMDSQQEYEVVEEVKEAFSLQFIPFRQGMLYVGSQEPLSDSELDLAQSLADTFSVAYARYEDFRQLEEAKARVDVTLTELKATQNQLIQKEKLASLGELTAGIAHEIQNPLNFVNNFSEVSAELVDELAEEQQKPDRDTELEAELLGDLKQNLQKINHHGQRASSIVRGMLEHSRASTGERQPTDLNALADEYLRLAYHGLRAKDKDFNADLKMDFAPGLPSIQVVSQDIGRVLLNLYNNAFYAVLEKQKTAPADYRPIVSVSTALVNGRIELRVQDNGTGIPESVKAKIFQPFFTTKPTGEGTGLGLSLSYDIVTKGHGGMLAVESREGQGSEFVVRLPM